jgi:hypothetical protein
MTVESAWQVLGRRGEQLATIAAPFLRDVPVPHVEGSGLDVPWPAREVLGDRISPELDRWTGLGGTLCPTYRGHWLPGVSSTVTAAVAARDGKWLARLQGLFLPVSAVLVEDEEICHATLAPGPEGNSLVYYTHQDEPGFWLSYQSLAALLAEYALRGTSYVPEIKPVPSATSEQWRQAGELLRGLPEPAAPEYLSMATLYPRTGWIVRYLLGVELEEDLADAPRMRDWQAERENARTWPHLQAYWLLHHLVFGNDEELPFLLEHAERRHPAVAELATLADAVVAGGQAAEQANWWDAAVVRDLRAEAVNGEDAEVMSEPAQARYR